MSVSIPTETPNEVNNYRNKAVWNNTAGSVVFNNSTGREYVALSHRSGSNITFANQATSEFNPNNRQTLTNGNTFETTKGNRYIIASEMEHRVLGDLNIITGSPKIYNTPILDNYIDAQTKLAVAKASPEVLQPGYGNNTGVVYTSDGDGVNPETGSTQGQTFKANPAQQNIQELYTQTQKELLAYEKELGTGGNIKLMSGKDVLLIAGTKPTTFDTVFINPNGRAVDSRLIYDGTQIQSKKTSAPYFEEKDVASNIPFGNVNISSSNKLTMRSAAGGINMFTSGGLKLASTGITNLQGAQVCITGSSNGGSTGHILIRSGNLVELEGGNINLTSDQHVSIKPGLSVTGDQIITGDLVVGGNLTVLGNIFCKKEITADGNIYGKQDITADGDIVAGGQGGVSLLNHLHPDLTSGGVTGKPIPG